MDAQRHDLGALFVRLGQAMIDAELPVLARFDLPMWDYVVLVALRDGPVQSQSRLSAVTGRDQTRLIPILDRLAERGALRRVPDPTDRRARIVELTAEGLSLATGCQSAIRQMERELLSDLPEPDRQSFVGLLERVAGLVLGRQD